MSETPRRPHHRQNRPPLRIDPREFYPAFAESMDDLTVDRWNDDPYCLCGCKTPTQQETSHDALIPVTAFRFWVNGHHSRMPWYEPPRPTPQQIKERSQRREAVRNAIDTAAISILLTEWHRREQGTWAQLAQSIQMRSHYVREIAEYRRKHIEPATAARILMALGEPLRPEVAAAYHRWKQRKQAKGKTP